jgi:membrane associated rhomboid family serine protease
LVVYPQETVPMVGASAAISGHMAGASRFVFARGGPLWGARGVGAYRRPAAPLGAVIRDPRVLAFLGIWFAVNLIFGLGGAGSGIASGAIAWDAHIGGFLAGLMLFPLFDPIRDTG